MVRTVESVPVDANLTAGSLELVHRNDGSLSIRTFVSTKSSVEQALLTGFTYLAEKKLPRVPTPCRGVEAHGVDPPAIAGTMLNVSPSLSVVSRLSRKRMSSSFA